MFAVAERSGVRRILALVAGATLLLAGCGAPTKATFTGIAHQAYTVAPIALTDTAGKPWTLADATTPLTLVFFGYTHCDDICPLVLNNLAVALTRLDDVDRAKVDLVFVTSDPTRDTPTVLKGYLSRYGEGFIGLTGKLADIVALGASLAVSVDSGERLPDGGYDLAAHGTTVSAVTANHQSTILWPMETSAAEYAADITTILHGKAPAAS